MPKTQRLISNEPAPLAEKIKPAIRLQHLPVNQIGRDIVIGDLHGRLDALHQLLNALNFDQTADRLISVGDLCDRGDQSLACLQLIDKESLHPKVKALKALTHHSNHSTFSKASRYCTGCFDKGVKIKHAIK